MTSPRVEISADFGPEVPRSIARIYFSVLAVTLVDGHQKFVYNLEMSIFFDEPRQAGFHI